MTIIARTRVSLIKNWLLATQRLNSKVQQILSKTDMITP